MLGSCRASIGHGRVVARRAFASISWTAQALAGSRTCHCWLSQCFVHVAQSEFARARSTVEKHENSTTTSHLCFLFIINVKLLMLFSLCSHLCCVCSLSGFSSAYRKNSPKAPALPTPHRRSPRRNRRPRPVSSLLEDPSTHGASRCGWPGKSEPGTLPAVADLWH